MSRRLGLLNVSKLLNRCIKVRPKRNAIRVNHFYLVQRKPFSSKVSPPPSKKIGPPKINEINSSALVIKKSTNLKEKPKKETLKFGKAFTDHMLEINWNDKTGWDIPKILPYGSFKIDPSASVLHYALEAFEGLKAYRDDNDQIRLFRPLKNMERLNKSCEALFFPTFDNNEFLECIKQLLRLEKDWIPNGNGYSLYIRPTIISTTPFIGVAPAAHVKLYVILSPVGPYYAEGFSAIKLLAENKYIRSWPKGVGDKKVGSNYAPTIRAQMEAAARGYSQVMWLFGEQNYITEVGTMNQFFFWINEDNEKELITAPLDGLILPGVTRDSILHLTREWNEFKVTERQYTIDEIIKAVNENRLLESFGTGTGAIISPVKSIAFENKEYNIPLDPENPKEQAGPLAKRLFNTILDIQYGRVQHEWSYIVPDQE